MQPRVRTNTLTGYADLARTVGLDPAAMVSHVGLELADLDVPDKWIPAAAVARLLHASAEQSACPDFGLRIAGLRRLGTLGPLAIVLREEPDLGSVLDLLVRYEGVYSEALHLSLDVREGEAAIRASLEFGEPVPHDQALDLVLGALVGIVRTLVSRDWMPLSASFARPAPEDARPWRRMFGVVDFGQLSTGLVLREADLGAPLITSDSSLRPYTQDYLRSVLADGETSTARDDVVRAVAQLMPLGRHSIGQVSHYLGVRPRALQRSLADRGETFSSVVHATRARLVEQYLPNERYSLTELSQILGFGAPSAFSRWFHQQFGTSPTEWRRTALDGEPPPGGNDRLPRPRPPR
jgi:AraC-like DNA-binding protein